MTKNELIEIANEYDFHPIETPVGLMFATDELKFLAAAPQSPDNYVFVKNYEVLDVSSAMRIFDRAEALRGEMGDTAEMRIGNIADYHGFRSSDCDDGGKLYHYGANPDLCIYFSASYLESLEEKKQTDGYESIDAFFDSVWESFTGEPKARYKL